MLIIKSKRQSKAFQEVLQDFKRAVLDQMVSQKLENPINESQVMN